jgi:adenylosuccinate synthase
MYIDVLLGLQWGDEGKGKIVDFLAPNYDIIARFQGGPNAGHTIYLNGKKFVLHTIPSGIFHQQKQNLIGNGVVINPVTLLKEIRTLESEGIAVSSNLFISKKASLIMPSHILLDKASEKAKGDEKIGSTLRGIGPAYMDKTGRNIIKIGDMFAPNFKEKYAKLKQKHLTLLNFFEFAEDDQSFEAEWFDALNQLSAYQFVDSEYFIHEALKSGKKILAEGAQGTMLDVDFGTYPFVTSSNTITGGVCIGLGVAPQKIREVYGVIKAYCTRVGSGPFPTELFDEVGEKLRANGHEFGATTGRPRRCGWLDIPAVKYACLVNGVTQLVMTKIDVLNDFHTIQYADAYVVDGKKTDHIPHNYADINLQINFKTSKGWNTTLNGSNDYAQTPQALKNYIQEIETITDTKITMISTGTGREDLILR